ncbi:MAG: GNAT family N-acetyltransferase [Thaumarchaeota archaeon]|nr:GNAT family N-acetyltransferase [Nitrososphaerota archaeon]
MQESSAAKLTDRVKIRELKREELDEAELIVRQAFGTFFQVPNPEENPGENQNITHRWIRNPQDVLAAELDGKLVGTNVLIQRGSFAYFGPLTVRPELWDSGIASKLMEATEQIFKNWGVTRSGLFTFAESPKHLGLYHKFGYYPRFLSVLMSWEGDGSDKRVTNSNYVRFSTGEEAEKRKYLAACQELTSGLYPGLDLSSEIKMVDDQKLGETLILLDGSSVSGFATCQSGPHTDAGKDKCSVKFAAAKMGSGSGKRLESLLSACKAFTQELGIKKLETGINLAHPDSFDLLLKSDFRISFQGIKMLKPNAPAYDRGDAYVLDDLR